MDIMIHPRALSSTTHPEFWINATARTFFVSDEELLGSFMGKEIQQYRLAAMWVARAMTGLSYPALARAFNKSDHTTILNGVQRAESDDRIGALVEEVLEYVEAGMPA